MEKINGVNLGNWLVLEKWMCPALFDSTTAEDEYYLARAVNVEDLLYDHSNDAEEAVDPNQAYIDAVLLEAQQITNQDPLTVAMDIQTAMDPAAQQLSADIKE